MPALTPAPALGAGPVVVRSWSWRWRCGQRAMVDGTGPGGPGRQVGKGDSERRRRTSSIWPSERRVGGWQVRAELRPFAPRGCLTLASSGVGPCSSRIGSSVPALGFPALLGRASRSRNVQPPSCTDVPTAQMCCRFLPVLSGSSVQGGPLRRAKHLWLLALLTLAMTSRRERKLSPIYLLSFFWCLWDPLGGHSGSTLDRECSRIGCMQGKCLHSRTLLLSLLFFF